jgi:hypothetical protein
MAGRGKRSIHSGCGVTCWRAVGERAGGRVPGRGRGVTCRESVQVGGMQGRDVKRK